MAQSPSVWGTLNQSRYCYVTFRLDPAQVSKKLGIGVNLVRSTLDGCIVVRSMSSSIIVLGCPVRPIPASLIPAGTPVFLANCYARNRVIQRSFCAAAIQSLACLLRVMNSPPLTRRASESGHCAASESCHERTKCNAAKKSLFDNLEQA